MVKILLRDRYYVPLAAINAAAVRANLEIRIETKAHCRTNCPLATKRGRYCSTCPSKDAKVKLWEVVHARSGAKFLAIPAGHKAFMHSVVKGTVEIDDRRPVAPMRSGLRWTGKLRDGSPDWRGKPTADQRTMLHEWRKHILTDVGGIIISPPRSGKTVMGVAASLATRLRTFVTASKIDFLRQFGKRYAELTTLLQLYKEGKRPVVLIDPSGWPDGPRYGVHVLKKWGPDVDKADVVMFCYQQLLDTHGGRERLKQYVDGKFGLSIGDEIDLAGAPCFSRVMNRAAVRHRLGLTATPHRKDGLMPVSKAVMGDIATIGRVGADLPKLELHETGIGTSRNYSNWAAMTKYLVTVPERNKIILRDVFRDLRSDKNACILIPTTRRQHVTDLVKMINSQAEYCRRNKSEDWPRELAVAYMGKEDTNAILNQINAGRARVTVAMVQMTQRGLDVSRWSHVYVGIVPTSNPYVVYQLMNRVCTPYAEELVKKIGPKPQAVVRYYIDQMSASVFCFKKLHGDKDYGIVVSISGNNFFGIKLSFADSAILTRMDTIARYPKSYSAADAGVSLNLGKTRLGKKRRKSAWTIAPKGVTKF